MPGTKTVYIKSESKKKANQATEKNGLLEHFRRIVLFLGYTHLPLVKKHIDLI